MTKDEREGAIRCLSVHSSTNGSGLCTDKQHYEAKQMAIKVLKQDPCEDAISRIEVIKSIDEREDVNGKVDAESIRTDIVLLPLVKPQEPTTKNDLGVDAVSRQAVCKIIEDIRDCVSVEGYWAFLERLKKLPPVNLQNCDNCEVGNPCLYCRHEFDPKESEEV